jgi:hypothetical protein
MNGKALLQIAFAQALNTFPRSCYPAEKLIPHELLIAAFLKVTVVNFPAVPARWQ